jgi:opacity protein-like surface antigen
VKRLMLVLLLLLMIPSAAAAQTPAGPAAPASAGDEPLPRRDVFGFIGWRGSSYDSNYFSGNQWDARFVYGGAAGFYFTPNLKLEADLSATTTSRFTEYQQQPVEGQAYPSFFPTEHRAISASAGALVIYQFFENASFHPFLGAGAGVITTRDRIYTPRQTQTITRPPPGPPVVIVVTEEQRFTRTDHDVRGLLLVGFKAYPSERWFFRTDVQWTPATGHDREISWRLGLGVDF